MRVKFGKMPRATRKSPQETLGEAGEELLEQRKRLEVMSVEQLRAEARRHGLPTTGEPDRLIDSIITRIERHGQAHDTLSTGGDGPMKVLDLVTSVGRTFLPVSSLPPREVRFQRDRPYRRIPMKG